jgi:hypothetical protein
VSRCPRRIFTRLASHAAGVVAHTSPKSAKCTHPAQKQADSRAARRPASVATGAGLSASGAGAPLRPAGSSAPGAGAPGPDVARGASASSPPEGAGADAARGAPTAGPPKGDAEVDVVAAATSAAPLAMAEGDAPSGAGAAGRGAGAGAPHATAHVATGASQVRTNVGQEGNLIMARATTYGRAIRSEARAPAPPSGGANARRPRGKS